MPNFDLSQMPDALAAIKQKRHMVTDRDIVCKGLAQDSFDVHRATRET